MLKSLRIENIGNVLNPLRNVKLRTKMTVGFLIIIVFIVILGQNSASSITKVGNEVAQLDQAVVPGAISLLELEAKYGSLFKELEEYLALGGEDNLEDIMDGILSIQTSVDGYIAGEAGQSDERSEAANQIKEQSDAILVLVQQVIGTGQEVQNDLDGLKLEMYNGAEVLGGLLDVQVSERLAEMDASIAAVNAVQTSGRRAVLIIGFGARAAAVLLRFVVVQDILRSIGRISQTCSEVGMGNFDARSEVEARDELGEMSDTLNAMLDNTLGLIQTREERDAMQASIQKLLREVSGAADGDLRVEAEVTADVTGAIADSFNLMIGQLRGIITGVQVATQKVSALANEIRARAEQLSQGSESQAMQIAETSESIEEMAASIAQVSESATVTASVGELSLINAQQGTLAVENTMQGMSRIRDRVQETAKRIKRLGESSQEIGEIVGLIGDIADRTSILSLNASIQAAMAGEAGQGFAVVAEEVERLADRALQATQQIETLIRTIQTETNEAVAAMEATTNEVVSGTKLAEDAGRALSEIESVSMRLAELSQSISQASQQQARGSEDLARSMSNIAEITQQTAEGTKQAANSISSLAGLADELRVSVSAFKLPGSDTRNLA